MHKETYPLLVETNLNVGNQNIHENECKSWSASDVDTKEEYNSKTLETKGLVKTPEKVTNAAAIMHLFKISIGTGILSLPAAFKDAGTIAGPLGIILVAILTTHCMQLLIHSSRFICRKFHCQYLSYSELAELCCKPFLWDKSKSAKNIVDVFLIINQLGTCSIYIIYVAKTVVELSASKMIIDARLIILILTPLTILISFVRSLGKLAYISTMANMFCVFGLLMILQFLGRNLKNPGIYPTFVGFGSLPTFFNIALFGFNGIAIVLPLYNKVKHPEDFPTVMNISTVFVAGLSILIGFFGYTAFGNNIHGSVTLNLPDNWFYNIIKCTYAVGTFFTIFIKIYVMMEIMLPFLLSKFDEKKVNKLDYLLRAVLVVITCLFAIAVPQIENFISLVGAISESIIGIIIPAIIHSLTFHNDGLSKLALGKNLFLILIGIAFLVIGTYSSIIAIVIGFRSSNNTYI
ncbi:proton-coupled amino acid transporter 1-like [Hydra vulgaris]|uniref:Proton-coupled amino acid transporter 1-like n=1 Tax=Hydra vulgaris TaxID=6087 RepID=A0ABM4CZZ3_HYDVU